MEKEMTLSGAFAAASARWDGRDRLVVVCAADYSDMALGLGETRMGLCVFACSSANVSYAHSRAGRMGHAAAALEVAGPAGEDFKRLMGIVGMAWSRDARRWRYRFLELSSLAIPDGELVVVYATGDLGRAKPDVRGDARRLRQLMEMYGVESSEPSPALFVEEETSTLADVVRHPLFATWLARAAQAEQKDASH